MNLGGYYLDCDLWLWFGFYDFGYKIMILVMKLWLLVMNSGGYDFGYKIKILVMKLGRYEIRIKEYIS